MPRNPLTPIISELLSPKKDIARALPDIKGGETPKQLKTANTVVWTHFTVVGRTELLYNAENWVRITITLGSAGPVAIGTQQNLVPVLGGTGRLLLQGQDVTMILPRATNLFIAAESQNQVFVVVDPIPWMEQVSSEIKQVGRAVIESASYLVKGLALVLRSGKAPAPLCEPQEGENLIPRPPAPLTPRTRRG